jgi:hypothetical protein
MKTDVKVKKTRKKYEYKLPKGQYLRDFKQFEDFYPKIAYDILANGGCQQDVMAEFQLTKNTFYRWKEEIQEFGDAIRAGQTAAIKWHRDFARNNLTNRNYNERAHGRLLKISFNIAEEAVAPLPELKQAVNAIQKSQVVLNAIADGRITPKQGSEIGVSILNDVKAEEATKLKQDIEDLKAKIDKGL